MNEMVQPELKVVNYKGMQMTTTGLVPGGKVSKEGVLAHLVTLDFYQAGINWCVGDLILEGTAAFGEDWMLQATMDHMSSMSEATQIQCQWVAQRFGFLKRFEHLSWSHHLVVAGMDDDTERTLLLESCVTPSEDAPGRSEDQPMGVAELRRAVRATRTDADGEDKNQGETLLRLAEQAILRLEYADRASLYEWMESNMDAWERVAIGIRDEVSDGDTEANGPGDDLP